MVHNASRRLVEGQLAEQTKELQSLPIKSLPAEDQVAGSLAESERHNASVLPNRGLSEMSLDHWLGGRMERRLPIIVVVRLAHSTAEGADADGEEKTYTDNISSRGARIFSRQEWQLGDALQVTPLNGNSACGKVVYCHKLPDNRYSIGVQFQDHPITWSILQRFGGT